MRILKMVINYRLNSEHLGSIIHDFRISTFPPPEYMIFKKIVWGFGTIILQYMVYNRWLYL